MSALATPDGAKFPVRPEQNAPIVGWIPGLGWTFGECVGSDYLCVDKHGNDLRFPIGPAPGVEKYLATFAHLPGQRIPEQ